MRAEAVEDYLASQGIQTWSADFPADDWRHISSSRVYDLAIQRIEAKGKGILLLHDIQARTVAALPRILQELKARGYRIVHVVPATPELPATPTEPQQWQLHPTSETVAISHWPKIPNFVFAEADTLARPLAVGFRLARRRAMALAEPFDRAGRHPRGVPLPQQAPWPQPSPLALGSAAIALPVPAQSIFEIQENPRATAQSLLPPSHVMPSKPSATPRQRDRHREADRGQRRHDPGSKPHLGGATEARRVARSAGRPRPPGTRRMPVAAR